MAEIYKSLRIKSVEIPPHEMRGGVIILEEPTSGTVLPIVIGKSGAKTVKNLLDGITDPGFSTHALLANSIRHLEGKVHSVRLMRVGSYGSQGVIVIEHRDGKQEVESRTSDALALAHTNHVEIHVEESFLEHAGVPAQAMIPDGFAGLSINDKWVKASAFGLAGHHDLAIKMYRMHLDDYPEDPNSYIAIGHMFEAESRYREAYTAFLHAMKIFSDRGSLWHLKRLANDMALMNFERAEVKTVTAPSIIECFDEFSTNHAWMPWPMYGPDSKAVFHPTQNNQHAYCLDLDFQLLSWPWLQVNFDQPQRWLNATALTFDVFITVEKELSAPLELTNSVYTKKHSHTLISKNINAGENRIELPLTSQEWGTSQGKKNPAKIGPITDYSLDEVTGLLFMVNGEKRAEKIKVYFSNIKLE